jgi:hypothetical protein
VYRKRACRNRESAADRASGGKNRDAPVLSRESCCALRASYRAFRESFRTFRESYRAIRASFHAFRVSFHAFRVSFHAFRVSFHAFRVSCRLSGSPSASTLTERRYTLCIDFDFHRGILPTVKRKHGKPHAKALHQPIPELVKAESFPERKRTAGYNHHSKPRRARIEDYFPGIRVATRTRMRMSDAEYEKYLRDLALREMEEAVGEKITTPGLPLPVEEHGEFVKEDCFRVEP